MNSRLTGSWSITSKMSSAVSGLDIENFKISFHCGSKPLSITVFFILCAVFLVACNPHDDKGVDDLPTGRIIRGEVVRTDDLHVEYQGGSRPLRLAAQHRCRLQHRA